MNPHSSRPINRVLGIAAGALSLTSWSLCSDIVEVLPLTDKIVMVHFDDGYVVHHKRGEPRSNEKVVVDPLDTAKASQAQNYTVVSADDASFVQPVSPSDVGRKSKGTDFAWITESWVDGRAVNKNPDHAKEHWVYLYLPRPMTEGKTYTIQTGALAKNGREWKLVFDPAKARSEAVHVNLLGYAPAAPAKYGYVYHWAGDRGSVDLKPYEGKAFHLINQETGEKAFSGKLAFRKPATAPDTLHVTDSPPNGNYLKADTYECDFSGFDKPGKYVLAVEGIGSSFPFRVDADVYHEAFYTVARGLYHNRSGIELKEPYTTFTRPAPHNPSITPGFKGKLFYTTIRMTEWGSEGGDAAKLRAAGKGPIESFGWYQDAGDWDSYYTHLRVAQELLFAYEVAPKNFTDGELNIPESKNGLPDILDEAAWLPRFCYRLRHELLDKGYATGGIGLRVAGDAFGGDEKHVNGKNVGQGSWEDVNREWAASGEDPWSTYRYAGVAAHLAQCLKLTGAKDPDGVDWEKEARESYAWAKANTREGDEKNGMSLKEPRAYAAAALFRLTGDKSYEQQFIADTTEMNGGTELMHDRAYGPMVYSMVDPAKADAQAYPRIRSAVLFTADEHMINTPQKRALRWGGLWSMPMLIGQQTTPWVIDGAVAYHITRKSDPAKAKQYLAALYTTADYFLGTNALNQTWATGLGPRHPEDVFHMDGWYNGKDTIHPGVIPYSPWRKEKDFGQGPWDVAWPHPTTYPHIDEWPGNERYFDNRCSPMGGEFTVHQNIGPAAAIYGLLCAPGPAAASADE